MPGEQIPLENYVELLMCFLPSLTAELQNIKNQLCLHTGKKDREELPLGLSNDSEERRSGTC